LGGTVGFTELQRSNLIGGDVSPDRVWQCLQFIVGFLKPHQGDEDLCTITQRL
jgi:hypothetical protein